MLILITGHLLGQSFEGTLVYKTNFEFQVSKEMEKLGITKEKIREKMKDDKSLTGSIKISYNQGIIFLIQILILNLGLSTNKIQINFILSKKGMVQIFVV